MFFILSLLWTATAFGQRSVLRGTVTDSITGESLPFASLVWQGTTVGTKADVDGHYSLSSPVVRRVLEVSYMGYDTKRVEVRVGQGGTLDIRLRPSAIALNEVIVHPGRERYKRRGNPAVDFVKKVIARRDAHDPRSHDYFSYDRYQRMVFAMNEYTPKPRKEGQKPGKFDFVREFVDTLEAGTTILPVSERERLERVFYRRDPKSEKTLLIGSKAAGVDEVFSREGIQQFLNEAFREVDIFQNNIPLFLQRFVSPLSTLGPAFYKYYLLDTVQVAGRPCMDLGFVPFNSESFGFTGHLYVTLDSTYFVRRAVLNVAKDINLNFVSHMTIEQEFERTADSTRLITKDDIRVNFKLTEKSKGMYAQRLNVYGKHSFAPPAAEDAALFEQPAPMVEQKGAYRRPDNFWAENRPEEARKKNPNGVDKLMQRLRSVPLFYFTEKVVTTLVSGYIPTNKNPEKNKFDLGPMNSTINGNAIEGVRLRLGGGTTPQFNKHWFFEGYAAYGTKDRKMKYDGLVEYSFNPRKDFRLEYPQHALRFEHQAQEGQRRYLPAPGRADLHARALQRLVLCRRPAQPARVWHALRPLQPHRGRRHADACPPLRPDSDGAEAALWPQREVLPDAHAAHPHYFRRLHLQPQPHDGAQGLPGLVLRLATHGGGDAEALLVLGLRLSGCHRQGRQGVDQGALSAAHPAQCQYHLHHPAGDLYQHERAGVHQR